MKRWLCLMLILCGCEKIVREPVPAVEPAPVARMSGGGTDVGSGGDNHGEDHLAAWFVGVNTISACFEVSSVFGVPKDVARKAIEDAFGIWKEYIAKRNLYRHRPEELRLATDLHLTDGCDANSYLAFYLGVENEAVQKAKGQFDNPTAFVQRTEFLKDRGLARGFVYVAPAGAVRAGFPDWGRDQRLLAALLHEIGHVFGNDHVPGTIMTENISELLAGEWPGEDLAQVDHCRELAPCADCSYYGAVEPLFFTDLQKKYFKEKLGVDSQKTVYIGAFRNFVGNFLGLALIDPEGEGRYSKYFLANRTSRPVYASGAKTFKVVKGDQAFHESDASMIQYTTAFKFGVWPLESVGMIVLEYNMATCQEAWIDGRRPLEASFVLEDEQAPLASFGAPIPQAAEDKSIYPPSLIGKD